MELNYTCHGESTHEQPDVPSTDHDALAPLSAFADSGVLILPRGPDAHEQDQEIEDHDSYQTLGVDGHLRPVRVHPPRSRAGAHRCLEGHGEILEEEKFIHLYIYIFVLICVSATFTENKLKSWSVRRAVHGAERTDRNVG